jgi:hypothetical protein
MEKKKKGKKNPGSNAIVSVLIVLGLLLQHLVLVLVFQ